MRDGWTELKLCSYCVVRGFAQRSVLAMASAAQGMVGKTGKPACQHLLEGSRALHTLDCQMCEGDAPTSVALSQRWALLNQRDAGY